MKNLANATPNTHVYGKFAYHLDDLDCQFCVNYRKRGGNGCGRSKCEFQDLRDECIAAGRIKRKRGVDKEWRE